MDNTTQQVVRSEAENIVKDVLEKAIETATQDLIVVMGDNTNSMFSGQYFTCPPNTIPPKAAWAQAQIGTVGYAQVDGVNVFLESQYKDSANAHTIIFGFGGPNDFYEIKQGTSLEDVKVTVSDLKPRHKSTAIYDNVSRLLGRVGTMVEEAKTKGTPYASVSILVYTDGEDNDSKHHTAITNKALVAMGKSQGWNIVYLGGGGQNAEQVGVERFGVDRGQCLTFNSANRQATVAALRAASDQVAQFRSARHHRGASAAIPGFTPLHRSTSTGTGNYQTAPLRRQVHAPIVHSSVPPRPVFGRRGNSAGVFSPPPPPPPPSSPSSPVAPVVSPLRANQN